MSLFPEIERRMKIHDIYRFWRRWWVPARLRPALFKLMARARVRKEVLNG